MAFLNFMSSSAGRIARVVAGLALVVVGIVAGGGWIALAVVGLIPLAAGAFDVCLIAPLARMPFTGKAFRERACRTRPTRPAVGCSSPASSRCSLRSCSPRQPTTGRFPESCGALELPDGSSGPRRSSLALSSSAEPPEFTQHPRAALCSEPLACTATSATRSTRECSCSPPPSPQPPGPSSTLACGVLSSSCSPSRPDSKNAFSPKPFPPTPLTPKPPAASCPTSAEVHRDTRR